jgi:hypothetical protein
MGRRNQQHHGASTGDDRRLPGRDVEGTTEVSDETIANIEAAQEVSRLIDENEGYDRRDNRAARKGGSHGGGVRRGGRQGNR